MIFYPPENPDHVSHSQVVKKTDRAPGIEVPVKRLVRLCEELGHREIDILKLDIEGYEYGVISDLLNSDLQVKQLAGEFQHGRFRFGNLKTRAAIRNLRKHGYEFFYVGKNAEEFGVLKA